MSIFYQWLGTFSGDLGKFYWQYQYFPWCTSCAPWTQSCWLVVWQYFWLWTLPQGKSRTPASGQSVTINLPGGINCHLETETLFDPDFPPGLTSWPGIIGSTRVQSRSNAKFASGVSRAVTTLRCTWKDIYQRNTSKGHHIDIQDLMFHRLLRQQICRIQIVRGV